MLKVAHTSGGPVCHQVQQTPQFYYATIAYHVGLIAVLGWPQGIMANV